MYLFVNNRPEGVIDTIGATAKDMTKADTKKEIRLLYEEVGDQLVVKVAEGVLPKADVKTLFKSDMATVATAIKSGSLVGGPLSKVTADTATELGKLAKGDIDKVTISTKGMTKAAIQNLEHGIALYGAATWALGGEADAKWNDVVAKFNAFLAAKNAKGDACSETCTAMIAFIKSVPTGYQLENLVGYAFAIRCYSDCACNFYGE